ncbi:MAG: vWA domain-containing protein, partial [Trebonia sp.]
KVVMPLSQLSEQPVPTLSAEDGTYYGAAFRMLAQTIEQDSARLNAQGYKVYRPCAFFLSDGEPGDEDWAQTFRDTLTFDPSTGVGMKGHPVFVPFGFRQAPEEVLRRLAYPMGRAKWYHSKSTDIEETLDGILSAIMNTVIASGNSASSGQPALVQQEPDPQSGIDWGDPEPWV